MAALTLAQKLRVAARTIVGLFDDNSMQQAFGMLSGIFPGAMGMPPYRGTREFLKAYSTMPWLRAVTSRIASSAATTEWQLFIPRTAAGKAYRLKSLQYGDPLTRQTTIKSMVEQQELEQIIDHPLLDALHEGNSMIDGLNLRKLTQVYLDIVGESFWIKERNGVGAPIAFWPVPPHWIINTPTPHHRFYRYSYRGWQGEIPDTEILWMTDPNPETPYYRGSGMFMALSDELESDEYAARVTRQFFFNNAKPDFLVYPKNTQAGDAAIRPEEITRVETEWLNKNQGIARRWKPYFLNKEVGVHEFEQDFRALQFVELRKFERDTILQTFGLPPEMLGVIDKGSNRATIDRAELIFTKFVITPRLEFMRSILQQKLVPEYDDRLILNFKSPVQDDKEFALAVATVFSWATSVDEQRAMGGQDKLDGGAGAVHMIPFNMQVSSDFSLAPPMPTLPSGPDAGKFWARLTAGERAQIMRVIDESASRQLVAK